MRNIHSRLTFNISALRGRQHLSWLMAQHHFCLPRQPLSQGQMKEAGLVARRILYLVGCDKVGQRYIEKPLGPSKTIAKKIQQDSIPCTNNISTVIKKRKKERRQRKVPKGDLCAQGANKDIKCNEPTLGCLRPVVRNAHLGNLGCT